MNLFQFCLTNGLDFLTVRVYIGIWLGIIGVVVVCFEGSVLVKLFTRFTEEIFAALISILYIVESIVKLFVVSTIWTMLARMHICVFRQIVKEQWEINEADLSSEIAISLCQSVCKIFLISCQYKPMETQTSSFVKEELLQKISWLYKIQYWI